MRFWLMINALTFRKALLISLLAIVAFVTFALVFPKTSWGGTRYCGPGTNDGPCCGPHYIPFAFCNGKPLYDICQGNCPYLSWVGSPTNTGTCSLTCSASFLYRAPKFCHSTPPDDKTCDPGPPVCGQGKKCRTTDCSICEGPKFCDCNYKCLDNPIPQKCTFSKKDEEQTCTGPFNAKDGCGNLVNIAQCDVSQNWTVSGNVFVDTNNSKLKDAGEQNYLGGITITISGPSQGTITYAGGVYTITGLKKGSYTVSYTSLPTGYQMTYPLNGPPPSFTVGLGPCDPGGSNSATCHGQRMDDLNFGINNSNPWIQCKGADCRLDKGFVSKVPASAVGGPYASLPGSGGTPGLLYSGNASYDFGQGQASQEPYNWIVGGLTYPETYAPTQIGGVIKTSYAYLSARAKQGNIPLINISSYCTAGISNCSLSPTLPHGIYISNGSLKIASSYTFPSNQNYIILVNGDLTISGRIIVPKGSTAIFSATGNIIVDKSIGEPASSTSSTIEGIYSSDKSFIAAGTNDCSIASDLRLNVAGNIIVNASLSGGSFQNQRDLCGGNISYPAFYISERADFILNTPEFVKQPNYTYQEIAP